MIDWKEYEKLKAQMKEKRLYTPKEYEAEIKKIIKELEE